MNEITTALPTQTPPPRLDASKLADLEEEVKELAICYKLAEGLCSTSLVPKAFQNRPQDGAVAILWGRHLGLNSVASLQNIAVINNMPTLWGDALVAIVKASSICEYLTSDFDQEKYESTVKTKRVGEPEETRTYSWADATTAGLTQNNTYQKHPKRMLQARARSHLLRDVYPDLIKGFQVREIIEEDKDVYGIGESEAIPNTDSDTLRELAAEGQEANIDIEDYIIGAATGEEFEQAREMIRDLQEGKEKERLKVVWQMNRDEVEDGKRDK